PKCETRPHIVFGHCTLSVVMVLSPASLPPMSLNSCCGGIKAQTRSRHSRELPRNTFRTQLSDRKRNGPYPINPWAMCERCHDRFGSEFTVLRESAKGLRCYTYNLSHEFRKHRYSIKCGEFV